jgi:hypothetical protein
MTPSLRAVRAFAIYDLLATAAFAIPVVGEHVLALLLSGFGLFGSMYDWLPLPVTTALFLHLTGILGVLWNGLRAYSLDPQVIRADMIGRLAVAALLAWFMLGRGVPAVLWLFVATELGGAAVAWVALRPAPR